MKKLALTSFISFFIVSFIIVESQAQRRSKKQERNNYRFNAGVILGLNFSQIDGDLYAGFDKRGLRMGIKGMIYLDKTVDLTTGITFAQRGSRFEAQGRSVLNGKDDRKIHLNYVEIPLAVTFKIHRQKGGIYRIDFGGSYSRLFSSEIVETITPFTESFVYSDLEEKFQNREFNLMGGLSYFFNRHIGVGITATYQLNQLYNDPNFDHKINQWISTVEGVEHLRNYQFGFQIEYHIF